MKKVIQASSKLDSGDTLGLVDDLPYKPLLQGTHPLKLKDLMGTEGETFYILRTGYASEYDDYSGERISKNYYYLEPITITHTKFEKAGSSMWVNFDQYDVTGTSGLDGKTKYFSNYIYTLSDPRFYSGEDADKIVENAEAILAENDYLERRATEVDEDFKKEVAKSINYQKKVCETNYFGNGEAEVDFGCSTGKGSPLCVYMHVKPTDGPFMSSSMYEVFYFPMVDGSVYRSYGAFGHASGKKEWFLPNKKTKEITQDQMLAEIDALEDIYENFHDGTTSKEVDAAVHNIFK